MVVAHDIFIVVLARLRRKGSNWPKLTRCYKYFVYIVILKPSVCDHCLARFIPFSYLAIQWASSLEDMSLLWQIAAISSTL